MSITAEHYEVIEDAIRAAADEQAYFIRQALDALPDDHAARDPLEDVLDGEVSPRDGLWTAYCELPPRAPDDESGGETAASADRDGETAASADRDGVTITAPSEGRADTYAAIADELCAALKTYDHVDYNALTHDELLELLDARDTVEELCLRYRDQQQADRGRSR